MSKQLKESFILHPPTLITRHYLHLPLTCHAHRRPRIDICKPLPYFLFCCRLHQQHRDIHSYSPLSFFLFSGSRLILVYLFSSPAESPPHTNTCSEQRPLSRESLPPAHEGARRRSCWCQRAKTYPSEGIATRPYDEGEEACRTTILAAKEHCQIARSLQPCHPLGQHDQTILQVVGDERAWRSYRFGLIAQISQQDEAGDAVQVSLFLHDPEESLISVESPTSVPNYVDCHARELLPSQEEAVIGYKTIA